MSSYSDPTERLSGDGAAGDGHAAPGLIGKRLGPWRVLELLGEGGMGLVYLGARDDQTYEQRVAIKVIRHVAAGTAEDFARFRRERQILARLEHPGIARLLDGGTTDDGSPYLVMEYVDGEPIDAYCEARALPIEERLRLFRGVCAAVQYAHQKLVVHRDIKPANILVTAEGKAVLLDFGIAKLRDPEQTESVLPPTETVLTPAYASPEQVRHEPVGTATDVYSLGVVLYELLTGNLPYAARSTFEMMQAICGEEPLPPSRAAPPRLQRRIAGDLDAIVLLALRKEPLERYGSAGALSDDIDRYLGGRPVHARPATFGYRAARFIRRNRLAVGAASLALLVILGFTIALTIQSSALARERDRAMFERDRAQNVLQFLVGLFDAQDPEQARGVELTARDILDRGTERATKQFRGDPLMRATLLGTIGRVRWGLGDLERARPLLEESVRVKRARLGDSIDTAEAMADLAQCVADLGESDRALVLYRESLAMRKRVLPADDPRIASALNDLGAMLADDGDLAAAESLEREALAILRKSRGQDEEVSSVLTNLGFLRYQSGRFAEAESFFREALATQRRALGGDHPLVLTSLNNLANAVNQQARFHEAEQLFREAIALGERILGPQHPDIARLYKNLGSTLLEQKQTADAVAAMRTSYQRRLDALGPAHPDVARSAYSLAAALVDLEPSQAEALANGALHKGKNVPDGVRGDLNVALARALSARGADAEAVRAARRGLELRTSGYPKGHWAIADAESVLGECLVRAGRKEEGAPLLRHGYEQLVASLGEKLTATQRARERMMMLRER